MTEANVNSTATRPDIPGEVYPEGDLPEQFGGTFSNLMPGIDTFLLPANLAQLWDEFDTTDNRKRVPDGRGGYMDNTRLGQPVRRIRLNLTRENPLIVVGGTHNDETMTVRLTSNPRPRGKATEETTAWISDLAYLLETSLQDKSRPKTPEAMKAAINRYAGRQVRLDHGLSAHCREDRVRFIITQTRDPQTGAVTESIGPDPTGTKGCGERFYTKDFKLTDAKPGEEPYSDQIECDCKAALRGFPTIDRFMPPLGVAVQTKK